MTVEECVTRAELSLGNASGQQATAYALLALVKLLRERREGE